VSAVADRTFSSSSWDGWGGGIYNNRWTDSRSITPANVKSLTRTCPELSYQYGISATPVIRGTNVYYPTWNGLFIALDYTTCKTHWTINVTQLIYDYSVPSPATALATYPISRTSPQIDGSTIYFGTQTHALLVAADLHTGRILGKTPLHSHPLAVVTISPTAYKGVIFAGTSSYEEPAPLIFPNYTCCSYIGNMVALTFSRDTGHFTTKWDIPTLPSGKGWSGAGVWGSQPSVDAARDQVFFGTGNLYSYPPGYGHCINATAECLPPGVNQEAIVALDIPSGKINWVRRVSPLDAWNGACVTTPIDTVNCPSVPPGRDGDFGMAPSFVPKRTSGLKDDVVVVAQKTGVIFAFAAKTGETVWMNDSSRMQGGGLSWGVAVDDNRVYYTLPYSRFDVPANVSSTVFGAASLVNGSVLWETPATHNSLALQPPTAAGDLVFYPRAGVVDETPSGYLNSKGALTVLDKRSGDVVTEVELDVNFQGGIAVVNGYVLFGTGYRNGMNFVGNGSLYVLKVDNRMEDVDAEVRAKYVPGYINAY
jgi:outer membrane protein assembly factor BamB